MDPQQQFEQQQYEAAVAQQQYEQSALAQPQFQFGLQMPMMSQVNLNAFQTPYAQPAYGFDQLQPINLQTTGSFIGLPPGQQFVFYPEFKEEEPEAQPAVVTRDATVKKSKKSKKAPMCGCL